MSSMPLMPLIEEDIPLPASATEALPDLSPAEELQMRARTIELISGITNTALTPTDAQQLEAAQLAKKMMEDPKYRPDFAKYPNETMAYLAGMVSQTNCMLVEQLSDLKLYVVNKLVFEIEHASNAKDRISALKTLGEVDGIDAFKRRTEVTMQLKSLDEVEKELKSVLEGIEYRVLGKISEETAQEQAEEAEFAEKDDESDSC